MIGGLTDTTSNTRSTFKRDKPANKADGTKITSEPYGESITRHMQEINTRQIYEQIPPAPDPHHFLDQSSFDFNVGIISNRPRYYIVKPSFTQEERRLWESKRISILHRLP